MPAKPKSRVWRLYKPRMFPSQLDPYLFGTFIMGEPIHFIAEKYLILLKDSSFQQQSWLFVV